MKKGGSHDLHGTGENGVIVLDNGMPLPEGTRVRVEPLQQTDAPRPTLAEMWAAVIGQAKGLPPDLAENHDHYLHGQPNK
jgi:hypothetical protein